MAQLTTKTEKKRKVDVIGQHICQLYYNNYNYNCYNLHLNLSGLSKNCPYLQILAGLTCDEDSDLKQSQLAEEGDNSCSILKNRSFPSPSSECSISIEVSVKIENLKIYNNFY